MMWFRVSILFLILFGCAEGGSEKLSSCDDLKAQVESLEKEVANHVSLDALDSSHLMRAYADFANACPGDSIVAEYLVRRADLLRGAGKFHDAIRLLQNIHDGYPTYENRALCAFLIAYLYETELGDHEMAEKFYNGVIDLHPDSKEAKIAALSLKHLGKSPEELVHQFQMDAAELEK
jgi:tetratricopeptide (TPR) repeat protein